MKPLTVLASLARLIRLVVSALVLFIVPPLAAFYNAVQIGLIDPRFFVLMSASFLFSIAGVLSLIKRHRPASVLAGAASCVFFLINIQKPPSISSDGAQEVQATVLQQVVPSALTPAQPVAQSTPPPLPQPVRGVARQPVVPEPTPVPTPRPLEHKEGEDAWSTAQRRYPSQ